MPNSKKSDNGTEEVNKFYVILYDDKFKNPKPSELKYYSELTSYYKYNFENYGTLNYYGHQEILKDGGIQDGLAFDSFDEAIGYVLSNKDIGGK